MSVIFFLFFFQFCYCTSARISGIWLYFSSLCPFIFCVEMSVLSRMGRCLLGSVAGGGGFLVSRLGPSASDLIYPAIVCSPPFSPCHPFSLLAALALMLFFR